MRYSLIKVSSILLLIMLLGSKAMADLTYNTYQGTGATPSFPGNGGSLYYGTVLSTGTVTSLNYNWGSGVVLDSGRNERVIVNFYGYITIPDTGSQDIQFYLYADDGVYMKIDDTVVINDWNEQAAGTWNYVSTDQTLTGGSTYYIDAWWYENGGGASIKLYWDQTGSVALVPSTAYSTTEPLNITPTSGQTTTINTAKSTTGNGVSMNVDGDNNTINIEQTGEDNFIIGTDWSSDATVTGNNNTLNIDQGNVTSSGNSGNNGIALDITGSTNTLNISQGDYGTDVGDHRMWIDIDGSTNTMTLQQRNDGTTSSEHFMSLDLDSGQNVITMQQLNDGDKILFLDINNNNNTVDVNQSGTGEHYLDISLDTGSYAHDVDISQTGSGDHAARVQLDGYSTDFDLLQQGSIDQEYNVDMTCGVQAGCTLSTTQGN